MHAMSCAAAHVADQRRGSASARDQGARCLAHFGTGSDPKIRSVGRSDTFPSALAVTACAADGALARVTALTARATHTAGSSSAIAAVGFTSAALAAVFATRAQRPAARVTGACKARRRSAAGCGGRAANVQRTGPGLVSRWLASAGSAADRQIRLRIQLARDRQAGQAGPTQVAEGSGHDYRLATSLPARISCSRVAAQLC
jgi:hypothetical protein